MRSPQELTRLMEYSDTKRIFILDALKYVEIAIEERLYLYDGDLSRNEIKIRWKDIMQYVFSFEFHGSKSIIVGWKGNNFKERASTKLVPDEIAYKSWEEIEKSLKVDPYRQTELTDWFSTLKKELEMQGFYVSDIYPFNSDSIRIRWNKNNY